MALAQPTNLLVQNLNTLVSVSQDVERHNLTDVLITESGDILITESGEELASERLTIITALQLVSDTARRYNLGGTLITFSQEVETNTSRPSQTLITFSQDVERHVTGDVLATLRQTVLPVITAAERFDLVFLDNQNVTSQTAAEFQISGSEGDKRTAKLWLFLALGPVNITSYQGRNIEIVRLINDSPVTLFKGNIDRPVYDHLTRRLELNCSDLRNERIGRESQSALKNLTGGLFSPVTQREDATGEQWVSELMKTVEGSLDYTSTGSLRFRPWAVGSPRYTLANGDVHDKDLKFEFATRSEIVNRVSGKLEYRFFDQRTFTHNVSASMKKSRLGSGITGSGNKLPSRDAIIPTKEALRSAVESVGGWNTTSITIGELPENGWYRDPNDPFNTRTAFTANNAVRETRGTGVTATLERYISQPKRESYNFTFEAPESVDQFGEIDGGDFSFAVESNIDPEVFEERGCSVGPEDDRRADVNLAIQALQAIASKTIKSGHRRNFVEFTYKANILPIEIGDSVTLNTSTVNATGFVVEFGHTVTRQGDFFTTVKLSISRVDSAVVVTEDFTLPAQPSKFELNAESLALPETPDCPALSLGETDDQGASRVEPDGTVVVVAPSIDRRDIDEIIGKRATTYDVEIPRDTFTVEVV